jgi:cytochrome b subunit of formate dehydrogenase
LFYLNITVSVYTGVLYYFSWRYYFAHGKFSSTIDTILAVSETLSNTLLIISGVVLVSTVFEIRQFYKQRNAVDALDTGALVRHATAFLLFLLAVLFYTIAFVIDGLSTSPLAVKILNYSE